MLYGQFEAADRQNRELVTRSIESRSRLIARALSPVLSAPDQPTGPALNRVLADYATDGTILKLMLRPAGLAGPGTGLRDFFYIAASPDAGDTRLDTELDMLAQRGVLDRLAQSCAGDMPLELRHRQADGRDEILTALIPIRNQWGCWVLISAHTTTDYLETSIGRPYWQTREVRIAAAIYVGLAAIAALTALGVWRSLRRFREVAHDIRDGRLGEGAFAARNVVPELASVAADFDQLVDDLRRTAQDIRQTSEENTHSFKAPIATIDACLTPLRRLVTSDNARATRSLAIIDRSLDRLRALVNAAQRVDNTMADIIETPRTVFDLTKVVADSLLQCRELSASRDVRLIRRLDEDVVIRGSRALVEVAIHNMLENALSFTPPGGAITVTLIRARGMAALRIEDTGPGVDEDKIAQIFERSYSHRPDNPCDDDGLDHAGLGLWVARRNIEALGGTVRAANRIGGGLAIEITLPTNTV